MLDHGPDSDGVISMFARDEERQRAALRQIETYWQALYAEHGAVPPRSSVDPRGMETALEHAFLLHRIAPGIGRLRVAGSHLNDLSGMEAAGLPISAMFAPDARDVLADALEQVFGGPHLLRAELTCAPGFGRQRLTGAMVILPLTDEAGRQDRALGGLVTHGAIGRTPRRFEITSIATEALPHPYRVPRAAHNPAQFAEPARAFHAAPRSAPHLRVVVSND